MIYTNTDPAVRGAGARFLAHVDAMNPGGRSVREEQWVWLYPPGEPECTVALRCAYAWSSSPAGPLVVVEWRPDEDPARGGASTRRCDRAVLWAWPDRTQLIVTDVRAWAPPAHVDAYLRRLLAIAEGTQPDRTDTP